MESKNIICVFAKCPRPGEVKSRLEETVGKKQAAFLARAFLMDTISTSLRVKDTSMAIAHWPPESEQDFRDIIYLYCNEEKDKKSKEKSAGIRLLPQLGSNLGARLKNALNELFETGAEKVLIIGSDSPQLDPSIFRAALELLNKSRVVLGPTFDGGYYLVGLSEPCPEIFNGINWGTPNVYRETTDILERTNIEWQELEISYDVDSSEDLELLYFEIDNLRLAGNETTCFHTEKCLRSLTE